MPDSGVIHHSAFSHELVAVALAAPESWIMFVSILILANKRSAAVASRFVGFSSPVLDSRERLSLRVAANLVSASGSQSRAYAIFLQAHGQPRSGVRAQYFTSRPLARIARAFLLRTSGIAVMSSSGRRVWRTSLDLSRKHCPLFLHAASWLPEARP